MLLIKKYLNTILVWIALIIAYFATRIYNIMAIPLFTDEAIYTRWSQIARYDANWRFISLTDGKQPSFVWIDMIFMKVFADPLLAGRMVSVTAGFASLIGIYFLASELFKNKRIGLIAAALYLIYPFSLVYDRMALYDSLVSAIAIWALYLEVLLVRRIRLDVSLILGMVLGFGLLTKNNALLSIYLFPFTLLLFDWKSKMRVGKLVRWASLAALSGVMAYSFFMMLRLSPFFHTIDEKTSIFVAPLNEWIKNPFMSFSGNFSGLSDWFISYFTIPAFILVVASLFLGRTKNIREKLLLVIWFALPFFALVFFGRILYPRFILFMTVFLLPLMAYGINYTWEHVKNDLLKYGLILASVFLWIRADYYILTDFAHAPIAKPDTDQFMNEWPAGGGVREVVEFVGEKAKNGKVYVATEGTFGSLATYSIEIYLGDNKNVGKRGIYPLPPKVPEDLIKLAAKMPVYFVLNDSAKPPATWTNVALVKKYQKGIGDAYMSLYEVIPNP